MNEETVAQRMAVSLGVSVESVRAAMEAAKEAFPLPEESLCGEEENLVTGNVLDLGVAEKLAAHYDTTDTSEEMKNAEWVDPRPSPPPPADGVPWGQGSEAWLRHCQQVGRNRCRAYDEAFGLVEAQLSAFVRLWPVLADAAGAQPGARPPTPVEMAAAQAFGEGFLGFVRHLRAVTQNVTGGKR